MDLQCGDAGTELGAVLLAEDLLVPVALPDPESPLDHEMGEQMMQRQVVEDEDPGMGERCLVHELVPRVVAEVVVDGVVSVRGEFLRNSPSDTGWDAWAAEPARFWAERIDLGGLSQKREELIGVVGDT